MPLFTAILALDKHDGNMLFGESNMTWDDQENVTDGYFTLLQNYSSSFTMEEYARPKNGISYYAICYTFIRKNNTAEPEIPAVLFS